MNQQLLITVLVVVLVSACRVPEKQYFSGTIEYKYSYTSDSLDVDSIAALRPIKGYFRYDSSAYQSRFINKDTTTYYYSGRLNRCISATNSTGEYACDDYGQVTDSVLSWKVYDTEEKILGYSCKILEMQKAGSWVKYYVSTDLHIAPSTYNKHRSYNWDLYGEKTNGGLILQSEHRFKTFIMKGIVLGVEKKGADFRALEIEEKLFSKFCK